MSSWDQWFDDKKHGDNYKILLENISQFISRKTKNIAASYFTPHDSSHCLAVEKIVKALIEKSEIKDSLSELEKFILFASVWVHDIGMVEEIAVEYLPEDYSPDKARNLHDVISAWFINKDSEFKKIFLDQGITEALFNTYVHTINIIIKYHRRKNDIDSCPPVRFIKGEKVRSKLLACLVRLGDTLHIDSSRFDKNIYNILQIGDFDRTGRLHWLKSYVVSAMHLDIEKATIFVTVDLPEPDENEKNELEENAERLKFIIHENIYEDVMAVSDTFRENNIRFYGLVEVNINYCPGLQEKMKEELIGILNDLDIVLSPNTSKVIKKSLDGIESLSKIKFERYELFYNQVDQLIKHLEKLHKDRPCHVGLGKIIAKLDECIKGFKGKNPASTRKDIANEQTILKNMVDDIEKERDNYKIEINKKALDVLINIKNVLLFGYSEMVSNFLAVNHQLKDQINLYVFECGGKRRLSITNSVEYNDGIHYALHLAKQGFKNIAILPDTSIASLLNDSSKGINKKNSLLLFGANGVDKVGNCGDTSGHLMMAIVAHSYGIPIKVIADRFKMGKIKWDPKLTRKGATWLCGQKNTINELVGRNIEIINYREDRIPKKFITEIITN